MALTAKQERFCEEYLVDCNAKAAAIRAGYSEDTAAVIGCENLIKPNISERIAELKKVLSEKTNITAERVLKEYAKIAFFDIRKIYGDDGGLLPVSEFDEDAAATVSGLESYEEKTNAGEETIVTGVVRKVKLNDKLRALEAIGKHIGMFKEDNSQKQPIIKMIGYGNEENP